MRIRRLIMPVCAAAAIATFAGSAAPVAAAATSGSAPGWRVVTTVGPEHGVTYPSELVASGPKDAWSTWSDCAPCSGPHQTSAHWIEHWSGRHWYKVSVPSKDARYVNLQVGLGANSSRDVWLFDGLQVSGKALHWNGSRWAVVKIPAWVVRGNLSGTVSLAVEDFGSAGMWVFSLGQDSFKPVVSYAARYYRGHWSKVTLPGIPVSVSAVSPTDIWAQFAPSSLPKQPRDFLARWDGRRWHHLAIPAVTPPPHAVEYAAGLLATGSSDLWLRRDIEVGSQGARTLYLLHWTDGQWVRVKLGEPTNGVDAMVRDGHGGLLLAANGPGPSYSWYFDHFNGGKWSRTALPLSTGTSSGQVLMMAWVPGTRSAWAAGNLYPTGSSTEVLGGIWKFGS